MNLSFKEYAKKSNDKMKLTSIQFIVMHRYSYQDPAFSYFHKNVPRNSAFYIETQATNNPKNRVFTIVTLVSLTRFKKCSRLNCSSFEAAKIPLFSLYSSVKYTASNKQLFWSASRSWTTFEAVYMKLVIWISIFDSRK